MITVQHLVRKFGPVRAVDDISFQVEKGEVVGFLGPNGAGKTTTMRILSGFLPATSGGVRVAGFDVLRESLEVRRRIGYLPEAVPLYREHRVCEMLELQARLHGMPRKEYRRRIPEVLERVGVLDRERQLVGHLSRGLKQRVGIAVALLPEPEVLILDEPTSGLDPLQRMEVRKLIGNLAHEHTVLLSSHILPEVEAVCPRVIIIHEGRIVADGEQSELGRALGGTSGVRLEAVLTGCEPSEAQRLLESLAGVSEVVDRGRLGIHHQFDVACAEDLREDVGALAAQRGWVLRELSWRQPSLEELFARIAFEGRVFEDGGLQPAANRATQASEPTGDPVASDSRVGGQLGLIQPSGLPPASPSSEQRVVYNLNPFDRGAQRELGKPVEVDPESGSADSAGPEGPA